MCRIPSPIAPRLILALLATAPLALAAESAAPSVAAEPAPAASPATADYSAAFKKFFDFGMPDTREATFVKSAGIEDPFSHNDGFAPSIAGFAWRMPDPGRPKSAQHLLVGGVALFAPAAQGAGGGELNIAALFRDAPLYAPFVPLPRTLVFREANLRSELERAQVRLAVWKNRRNRKAASEENPFSSPGKVRADRLAPYLILAAHGWRAGHVDEANRLAATAMGCTDRPEQVAKAALSCLADARWSAALAAWAKTPEPAALAAELETVLARFAQGWKNAPAARHLLRQLRSAKPAADPVLENHPFTPAQLRFAREMIALREPPKKSDWLSPAKDGEKPDATITFLREQGIEALPLLAVLSEDATSTACVDISPPLRHEGFFHRDDDRPRGEADAFREWKARPLTRGEIAARLLEMPRGYSFDVNEERTVSDAILVAYHVLRKEGRIGLLLEKLSITRTHHRGELRSNLMEAGLASDADAAKLEAGLPECDDKSDLLRDHFEAYLAGRGPKAAAFFEKFAAAARAELEVREEGDFAKERQRRANATGRYDQNVPDTKAGALAEFDRAVARLRPLTAAPASAKTSGKD